MKLYQKIIAGGLIAGGLACLGIGGYSGYKQSRLISEQSRLRLEPVALFYHYTSDNKILSRVIRLKDKENLDLFRKMPQFQEVEGAYGDFDNDGDLDFIVKSIFGIGYFENINDDKNPEYKDRGLLKYKNIGLICPNSTKLEDIISEINALKPTLSDKIISKIKSLKE